MEQKLNTARQIFIQAVNWLNIYFRRKIPHLLRQSFPHTTPFRKAVYDKLLMIPYWQTMTYREITSIIADMRDVEQMLAQAVGDTVGYNPISIIIPCHRVVGANRSLMGYANGLDKKIGLMKLQNSL